MEDMRWTFGDRVRKVRRGAGLSSREFALALGITNSALAQWETDRSLPRRPLAVADDICRLTGADPGWLLCGCCETGCIPVPAEVLEAERANKGGCSPTDLPQSA